MYLARAMADGNFGSALLLIKIDDQSEKNYNLVLNLNSIYDNFPSPERRLTVLAQILMYYNYNENNAKEFMRYLKLFMDQDIDDTFKKRILIVS